jgi:hypothetical protein
MTDDAADLFMTPQDKLARAATRAKKAGDWAAAIDALRQRKAILGVRCADTRLPKYLQQAGRFDEAMAEIDWLAAGSMAWAREQFAYMSATWQQWQRARHLASVHAAAALICKRAGRKDLQEMHQARAGSYSAIAARLEPFAQAESAALEQQQKQRAQQRLAEQTERALAGAEQFSPAFDWVWRELVYPPAQRQALFEAVLIYLYDGIERRIKALRAVWPAGAAWPSGHSYLQQRAQQELQEEGEWQDGDAPPQVTERELFVLLLNRFLRADLRVQRNAQLREWFANDELRRKTPFIVMNQDLSDAEHHALCGRGSNVLLPVEEGLRLMEELTCAHPACRCTFDAIRGKP